MGVYVSVNDIEAEFRDVNFGATNSLVTDVKVEEFIDQAEAYVNGKISCKYMTPITSSISVPIVKTICIYLVADRIAKIMRIKTSSSSDQDETKSLTEIAEEMLEAICSDDLKLLGATLQETGNGVNSWSRSNKSTFSRVFKRGETQW